MPPSDEAGSSRAPLLIAGAAIGVLTVIALLFGLVDRVDARYVTRAEYVETLKRIDDQMRTIGTDVRELRTANMKGKP